MNIGKEGNTSKIDKKGVTLLTNKLMECDDIECHFNAEDKIPNTDGYFIISKKRKGENVPSRRFDVQIKSTENPKYLANGDVSFQLDTKFINYANLKVSTDPCILFHVDVLNKKIYFKLFTDSFLENNYFLDDDKEKITIHFDSKKECIDDTGFFYKVVLGFIEYKKEFNIKSVNIVEYQKAFEIINNLFERDLVQFKDRWYKNVWKFGIAYQNNISSKKEKESNPFVYDTQYGVYKIEYGEKTLPFQQLDIEPKKSRLEFVGSFTSTTSNCGVEDAMKDWISGYIYQIFDQKIMLVPFLPIEAINEILINKYSIIYSKSVTSVSLSKFEEEFQKNINLFSIDERDLISCCIISLKANNVSELVNPFIPLNSDYRIDDFRNTEIMKKNSEKLISNLPIYYDVFIKNLFGNMYVKYKKNGHYYFDVNYDDSNILGTFAYVLAKGKNDFNIEICSNIGEKEGKRTGMGILDIDYRNKKDNLMNILSSLMYKTICDVLKLEYRRISNYHDLGIR